MRGPHAIRHRHALEIPETAQATGPRGAQGLLPAAHAVQRAPVTRLACATSCVRTRPAARSNSTTLPSVPAVATRSSPPGRVSIARMPPWPQGDASVNHHEVPLQVSRSMPMAALVRPPPQMPVRN